MFQGNTNGSLKHSADETSTPLSPVAVPAPKQLKYTAGIVNSPSKGSANFSNQALKVCHLLLIVDYTSYLQNNFVQ